MNPVRNYKRLYMYICYKNKEGRNALQAVFKRTEIFDFLFLTG